MLLISHCKCKPFATVAFTLRIYVWVYRTVWSCLACVICPLTAARSSPRGGALKQRKNTCRNKGFRWVESERLPLWGSSRRRRVRGQFPRVSTNQQPYKPQFVFCIPSPKKADPKGRSLCPHRSAQTESYSVLSERLHHVSSR